MHRNSRLTTVAVTAAVVVGSISIHMYLRRRRRRQLFGTLDPPEQFICPITKCLMENPVLAADGHAYEHSAIMKWLERHDTSPLTREKLASNLLVPAHPLRSQIKEYRDKAGLPPLPLWQPAAAEAETGTQQQQQQPQPQAGPQMAGVVFGTVPLGGGDLHAPAAISRMPLQPAQLQQALMYVFRHSPSVMTQLTAFGSPPSTTDAAACTEWVMHNPILLQEVLTMLFQSAELYELFMHGAASAVQAPMPPPPAEPPLVVAVRRGDVSVIEQLCAEVNSTGNGSPAALNQLRLADGQTLLHIAALEGQSRAIRLLISRGMDPNARTNHTRCAPLTFAALKGHVAAAQALIESNANVDVRSQRGMSPLHHASQHGHSEMVSALVTAGADIRAPTEDGTNVLHLAAIGGHVATIESLLAHGGSALVHSKDHVKWEQPLHCAAYGGHSNAARVLLQHTADTQAKNRNEEQPLHIASWGGFVELARTLLDANASVNAIQRDGCSALHLAVRHGNAEMVRLYLAHAADVTIQDSFSFGALHMAAWHKHAEIVQLLIDGNAPLDCRSKNLSTPLIFACWQGCTAAVQSLLEAGSDVFAQTEDGDSALHQCACNNHIGCAMALLNKYPNSVEREGSAVRLIDATKNDGMTALHLAASRGLVNMVEVLLQFHADANLANLGGVLPIELAQQSGRQQVVDALSPVTRGFS